MKKNHRRFPLFDVLLTTLTLLLIGSSAYLLFYLNSDTSASLKKTTKIDDVPSTIDETESNFAGIKIITEISNDTDTPFAIQYPQSNHLAFNDKVKKYIKSLKYDYLLNITENKQENKNLKNELNISFDTFKHPNGTYSFVIVHNESLKGQEDDGSIHTFHLNPETGEMPTLQDVVTDQDIDKLAEFAVEYLYETEKVIENHLLSVEEVMIHTEPLKKNYEQFALTDEMITFYFTEHQSNDYIPIVSIPYEKINDLLKKDFQITKNDGSVKENNKVEVDNTNGIDSKGKQDEKVLDKKKNPSEKRVALTFDDGPDPDVTTRILTILDKYEAKATFYMLGSRVEYYPEVAKKVHEAGHELGNHSWTHPDLTKANTEKIFSEIDRTSRIIEAVTGEKPFSFRPPYGAVNDVVKQQTDLPIALWDVDTLDWKHRSGLQLLTYVQNSVKDGSIILMHDIHPSTADGLDAVMAFLVENGYTFVTVSELTGG